MRTGELNRVVRAIQEMSWSQRRVLRQRLKAAQAGDQARAIVEDRLQALRACPHCHGTHVVRNGTARGLQRYRCRGCGRTFNALTHTPLARLRYRERWLDHGQALIDGLSITKAALCLEVARSTAFRWRHRFLALPHQVKASHFDGIVEADETCFLKSCKGQRAQRRKTGRPPRHRASRATQRGMSDEHDIVPVVRDRSGACADQIVQALDSAHLAAVLQPLLAADAVLCTDGSNALAAAARHIGVEHHALNLSAGQRVIGPWHINNVNGYHSRLKLGTAGIGPRGLRASILNAHSAKHKVMEAMRLQEDSRQLSGRVVIDDAYLGGERSGGKSGPGSQKKVPFVLAVQTTDGGQPHLVCAAQLPLRRDALQAFAARRLLKPLTLVSDGLDCFRVTAGAGTGAVHQRIFTGGGKASVRVPALAAVNTLLGNFKTAVTGTLHAFKFDKYAPRYLADYQFRFNRRYQMRELVPSLLHALALARPRKMLLVGAPEVANQVGPRARQQFFNGL
jgi:transposase-like protein